MKIIKAYDGIELIDSNLVKECEIGSWHSWERIYIIQNDNGKIAVLSLNIFERILRLIFCINYFERVFNKKNVKVLSPKQLKSTDSKVIQHREFLQGEPATEREVLSTDCKKTEKQGLKVTYCMNSGSEPKMISLDAISLFNCLNSTQNIKEDLFPQFFTESFTPKILAALKKLGYNNAFVDYSIKTDSAKHKDGEEGVHFQLLIINLQLTPEKKVSTELSFRCANIVSPEMENISEERVIKQSLFSVLADLHSLNC